MQGRHGGHAKEVVWFEGYYGAREAQRSRHGRGVVQGSRVTLILHVHLGVHAAEATLGGGGAAPTGALYVFTVREQFGELGHTRDLRVNSLHATQIAIHC